MALFSLIIHFPFVISNLFIFLFILLSFPGTYICGNELQATLVVVSHPICTPPSPSFVENHNLTLKCVIISRGGPKPEVYWRHTKRAGVKLPLPHRRRGHGGGGSGGASRNMNDRRNNDVDNNDDDDDENDDGVDEVSGSNGDVLGGAGGTNAAAADEGVIAANLGELWFAGNTSYNTFSFQVNKQGQEDQRCGMSTLMNEWFTRCMI